MGLTGIFPTAARGLQFNSYENWRGVSLWKNWHDRAVLFYFGPVAVWQTALRWGTVLLAFSQFHLISKAVNLHAQVLRRGLSLEVDHR